MAVLRAVKGVNPGQVIPLTGDAIVMGRHPDCDIVLDVGAVSRQHAKIVREGERYFIEDCNSRNGTFVNEERIAARHPLTDQDEIKICDLVFSFHSAQPRPGGLGQTLTAEQLVAIDEERAPGSSTIMSKVAIATGSGGLRVSANPEVKLKALLEIGRNLGRALRLEEVLPKLLDSLFTIFLQADRGFVLLKEPGTGRMIPKAVKHRREGAEDQIRISRTILNGVIQSKEAILSADAATDSRFGMSESIADFHIHSIMAAPLLDSEGEVLGVIQIDTLDQRRRFNHDDLEVLASVSYQAAMAVENAQLHERRLQEEVLQRELGLAHTVQLGLLPAGPPSLEGYEFHDFYEPAKHLGGDYFDYIPLPNNRFVMALGDVSGKGIAASLLMARLSADARYTFATYDQPADAVARLNCSFCQSRWEGRFITFVVAILDLTKHEICLVNAGHLLPLLCHPNGEIEEVTEDTGGLPLGIDSDSQYGHCHVKLQPGDSLIFYTDGIPDAINAKGEYYTADRLKLLLPDMIRSLGPKPAAESPAREVLREVRQFVAGYAQADDMCMTWMRRLR